MRLSRESFSSCSFVNLYTGIIEATSVSQVHEISIIVDIRDV